VTTTLSPDTDREAWLAARRKGIGASEIAAVLGISPWESPFSLYHRKVNGWEVTETEIMRTGTLLEPVIADWWIAQTDGWLMNPGLMSHPDRDWQLATPDRLWCTERKLEGVLECKWVAQSWDHWGEPDTDDVPVHYRAQVQWQCDVVGAEHWYIAALGPGGFRSYEGHRDEKDIAVMVEAGRRFMARIEASDPPPLDDHHATLATVKRLHPDLDDTEAQIPPDIAAGYRRACAMERTAKRVKARYETRLREAMGRARRATSGGTFVASRSIYEVDEHTVKAHTVDRLNPARGAKKP
jgi:putative phage-type endonuclease